MSWSETHANYRMSLEAQIGPTDAAMAVERDASLDGLKLQVVTIRITGNYTWGIPMLSERLGVAARSGHAISLDTIVDLTSGRLDPQHLIDQLSATLALLHPTPLPRTAF